MLRTWQLLLELEEIYQSPWYDSGLPPWDLMSIFGTSSATNQLYNLRQVTYLLEASVFPSGKWEDNNHNNHCRGTYSVPGTTPRSVHFLI